MPGPLITITGASGGVGASTLAAALAAALGAIAPCLLVDLDLIGGGLDVTCGIEDVAGLRWPDLSGVRGAVLTEDLVAALPRRGPCAVLSAGPSHTAPSAPDPPDRAVADVLGALVAAGGPTVVDVPRWALVRYGRALRGDPPARHLVPTRHLVVAGTRTRDLADLDAMLRLLPAADWPQDERALVTVGPEPDERLVAAVEEHVGLPHAGHIGRIVSLRSSVERGQWPGGRAFTPVTTPVLDWWWRRGGAA